MTQDSLPFDEAPVRQLTGGARRLTTTLAVGLSLYAVYWVLFIVQPQIYRVSFLLVALVLTFLRFPRQRGDLSGVSVGDWALRHDAAIDKAEERRLFGTRGRSTARKAARAEL